MDNNNIHSSDSKGVEEESEVLSTNKYKHRLSNTDSDISYSISKHFKKQEDEEDISFNLSSLSQENENSSSFTTFIDQQINQNQIQQQSPPLLSQQILSSSSSLLSKSDIISIDFPIQQQQQQQPSLSPIQISYFSKFQHDIKDMLIIESVNEVDKQLFQDQFKHQSINPIFESKYTNRPPFFKKKTCIRDKLPCDDNKSFLYCIAYHFSQKSTYLQDYKKMALDKYIYDINQQHLCYPVNPYDENILFQFETNNNIAINIFYMNQQEKVEILRNTSFKDHSHKIDVVNMLFHKSSDRTVKYLYIASLPTILGYVYNQSMKNKHVCPLCLQILDTAKKLELHNSQYNSNKII